MERVLKKLRRLEITDITTTQSQISCELGDDMIFEILSWLPAKSLMQFKCVCKAWNNLIRHDPYFAKTHTTRSHIRGLSATHLLFELHIVPPPPTITHILPPLLRSITQQKKEFTLKLVPHHYSDTSSRIFLCSNQCNGLMCFYKDRDKSQLHLYNITTGEMKVLPINYSLEKAYYPQFFLGFDMITEKYKLLHVIHYENQPKIEILTLGIYSWSEIEVIPENYFPKYFIRQHIFLDGILYWRDNSSNSSIDYFNFRDEKFGILSKVEANKLIMKYKYDDNNNNSTKVASLPEAEKSKTIGSILATTSLINVVPDNMVFPDNFKARHLSRFIENIIPLTFIEVQVGKSNKRNLDFI